MRCFHCKAEYDAQHFARIAENRFSLHWEDWDCWRFSGRYLIAPGKAGKITPQRLAGLLWEDAARLRALRRCNDRTTRIHQRSIVALPARERFDGQA